MIMNNNKVYSINDLTFHYDKSNNGTVIKNMDLVINKDNVLVILGPNGSGKSTLIKLMAKILSPSKGMIQFYGKDLTEYSHNELAKFISYVPQNFFINFNYDVYSIVETGRYPHIPGFFSKPSLKDTSVINEVINSWGLNSLKNRSILELSGGERQLAIIASAIAQTSKVLLFDEPTSNLDLKHIKLFYDNIIRIKKDYDLIIIVSHDINLASMLADKVLFIKDSSFFILNDKKQILNTKYLHLVFETGIVKQGELFYIEK